MASSAANEEKLILPVNEKPTFWNQNIFKGAFFGSLLLSAAGATAAALGFFPASPETIAKYTADLTIDDIKSLGTSIPQIVSIVSTGLTAGVAGTIGGGILGGFSEKRQMQHDLENGKEVGQPTFWNKSIFTGLFIGNVAAAAIFLFTAAISGPGLGVTSLVGSALAAIAPIWGAIRGGFVGKEDMQQEYNQALALREQGIAPALSRSQENGTGYSVQPQQNVSVTNPYRNSVSLEEAQMLEARTKNSGAGKADFAAQLEAARNQPIAELSKA